MDTGPLASAVPKLGLVPFEDRFLKEINSAMTGEATD
jgi:hypothetical protein